MWSPIIIQLLLLSRTEVRPPGLGLTWKPEDWPGFAKAVGMP